MTQRCLLIPVLLLLATSAMAQDVIVTRHFTGLWDQPEHESQGINLQIIDQNSGAKVGVAYWFTYGADMQSAWFFGVGPVAGNHIEMTLFQGSGIGFLEANQPGNDRVTSVGEMTIEFSSCTTGTVSFDTDIAGVDSGMFDIERFTDLFNTRCSGGVSDDTPSDVAFFEQRIALVPARDGVLGNGHADFKQRPDRTEFSVEVEDLADGNYRILVGGEDRGELVVNLGIGETEFRSPVEAGKVLLTFDPRGELIEVHDNLGAVLTSGEGTIDDGDDPGGSGLDFGSVTIEVDLNNPGVYPLASGDAKLEPREDRTDFSVEAEDLPIGDYTLRIGGMDIGTLPVRMLEDGSIEGELEFRDPVEPGKLPLDFDPRGQQIDVLEGATVVLEVLFPSE